MGSVLDISSSVYNQCTYQNYGYSSHCPKAWDVISVSSSHWNA